MPSVDPLLSARLFLSPRLVGDRLYFASDLSGRLSLYVMDVGGSVPEPLLAPHVALQNPHLLDGSLFEVLPHLDSILVMLDQDGDEAYRPVLAPLDGGPPEPLLGERFAGQQVLCGKLDPVLGKAVFTVDSREDADYLAILVDLESRELTELGRSPWGSSPWGADEDFSRIVLADEYTSGDVCLSLWAAASGERRLLYGQPIEERSEGEIITPNGIGPVSFAEDGLIFTTSLFEDGYGLGWLELGAPDEVREVPVEGTVHVGPGELERIEHLADDRYILQYNIDGRSWVYEGRFDRAALRFEADNVVCGRDELRDGVLQSLHYDRGSDRFAASFSSATSPCQLWVLERGERATWQARKQTRERILGIPASRLAPGEDATFTSHDGLVVPARLYLPSPELGLEGPRPVIFYIHGGPQSQERPDFTWFSMPLIQNLTLHGFAVYVPNARGSMGYGQSYMKRVDRDWGGQDRLDHAAAFDTLKKDPRLDLERAGVMGRSYGGYMTLMQLALHPELWKAGCDMFGPYDLFTFLERLPKTWQTHFHLAIGHPKRDRAFLVERSPSTHLDNLSCPLLVVQGANDPRVVEQESRDLVERLRGLGRQVEYMVFDDEGHDVIKHMNKVRCYDGITAFFREHLRP